MKERKASDLHLSVGNPPILRINGVLTPLAQRNLDENLCHELIYEILSDEQRARIEENKELDLSRNIPEIGRIRMNVYYENRGEGAAIRMIPDDIPSFNKNELEFPVKTIETMKKIVNSPKGLVLVTGPTGCGKSTTLASIIQYINITRPTHIVTIEDPIEFIYQNQCSIIHQREVGVHTHSFANALRHVLRQDPNVILVGEMRDLETISMTLTAAETGHLVFATLHTPDAIQSVNRIIDVYPPHQQQQVRTQLSFVLKAVISQILIPNAKGEGRVVACEVLIVNPAISNLIREGKIQQAYTIMQAGGIFGMQTMDMALVELLRKEKITSKDVQRHSLATKELIKSQYCPTVQWK